MAQNLRKNYAASLQRLHKEAQNGGDLERRLQSLAKGIRPVTVNIFLRELRGLWAKADPLPSDLWVSAPRHLGLLSPHLKSPEEILAQLKKLWQTYQVPEYDFGDFEAALVSYGLIMRRKKLKRRSPAKE